MMLWRHGDSRDRDYGIIVVIMFIDYGVSHDYVHWLWCHSHDLLSVAIVSIDYGVIVMIILS